MTHRTHRETTLAAAVRSLMWKLGVVMTLVIAGFTTTSVLLLRIMLLLPVQPHAACARRPVNRDARRPESDPQAR